MGESSEGFDDEDEMEWSMASKKEGKDRKGETKELTGWT